MATLAPELKTIAPVRSWQMGREEEIAYAREHGIPVKGGTEVAPYSIDDNLWGRSSEGRWIEDLDHAPEDDVFQLVTRPEEAPDEAEIVTVEFEAGVPVAFNGERLARSSCSNAPPRSAAATASASSTTSRIASSASRCATSTRCRRRRSCCPLIRSWRSWSARSTRTSSSRTSIRSGPTWSTPGSGGSRCAPTSTPT